MRAVDSRENDRLDTPVPDGSRVMTEAPRRLSTEEIQARNDAFSELRQQVDGGWERRKFEPPREELARFNPERAGLPAVGVDEAAEYLRGFRASRPWLAAAEKGCPESQRIFVAMDAGNFHGHIRHEGGVTEDANRRRVAYMEDPAQLDPVKRAMGIDGLKPNEKSHWCASIATRITDPDAFATAFARGAEHSTVRQALDSPFDPLKKPKNVSVPIAALLGPDGYNYCTGWQLTPINGSIEAAQANRKDWISARSEGRRADAPATLAQPIKSFQDGVISFIFGRNYPENNYTIATLYADPPEN